MILYEKKQHELLVLNWWLSLKSDPTEFNNLFLEPLQCLTEILWWAANTVKIAFEFDDNGIWIASWVEPAMSGAYYGLWVRKDKRKSKAMLRFVDTTIDKALETFPVLMAPTKQARLQSELERLGFVHQGNIPYLFDGAAAGVYYCTKETRDARFRRWQDILKHRKLVQSLRGDSGTVRTSVPATGADVRSTRSRSAKNRRRKRANPDNQSSGGREQGGGLDQPPEHAGSAGEGGAGEHFVWTVVTGAGEHAGGSGNGEHPD